MALLSFTDLEVKHGAYTEVYSDAQLHNLTLAQLNSLVDEYLYVSGDAGTGLFTAGFYRVLSWSNAAAAEYYYLTLNAACATGNAADGIANLGNDPFTMIYDLVWLRLAANAEFTALVALRNRMNLSDTDPDPYRKQHATSDLPEARLEPGGFEMNPWSTSSTSTVVYTLNLIVATGDKRVDQVLLPVQWAVMQSMHPLADGRNSGLVFATGTRITGGGVTINPTENLAWVTAITMEFTLMMTAAQMTELAVSA